MKKFIFMLPKRIRRVIAKRTKKTYTINILSKDTDVYVIENLSGNSYTPTSNLQYFINVSEKYCTSDKERIYAAIANNHNINFRITEDLMEYGSEKVKCNLAKNPEASYIFIREKLACDKSKYVRYTLGMFTKFDYVMDKLLKDPEPFVHSGVAYNKFLRADKQREISENTEDFMTIIALLQNPNVIPDVLDEHSNGGFDEKLHVAAHLNTRVETLERLKKDKYWKVRKMAKYNLKHKKKIMRYSWKSIR